MKWTFVLGLVILLTSCATPVPAPSLTPRPSDTPVAPTATATVAPSPVPTTTPTAQVLEPIRVVTTEAGISGADTVLDGETAQYAKRVLAAYINGQVPNFDTAASGSVYADTVANFAAQGYGAEVVPGSAAMLKGATVVQDGNGGVRLIQMWLQKDGTPGLVWYHLSAAFRQRSPSQFGYKIKAGFGELSIIMLLPLKPRDLAACRSINFIAKDDCPSYMDPQAVSQREQAVTTWIESGMVPEKIQDGTIEFLGFTHY